MYITKNKIKEEEEERKKKKGSPQWSTPRSTLVGTGPIVPARKGL
jgi:hypothetical protein